MDQCKDQCKDSLKYSKKDSLDRDKVDSKPNNLRSLLVAKTHTPIRTSIKI